MPPYTRSSPYLEPGYLDQYVNVSNDPYAYTPPANPIRFDPTTDPKKALANERARATAAGDTFADEFRGATAPELEEYRRYRRQADTAYGPIARGEGGYSVPEATGILDQDRLEGLQLTPQEYNEAYMTPDEQASSLGDPRSAFAYFNPQYLEGVARTGADYERDVINDTRNEVRNAYQDPSLLLDPMYGQVQTEALSGMESGVRGAYDPRALSLDPNFASRYPMSDAEVQAFGDLGARMASSRYAALGDEATRRGSASGSPALAIAALKQRLEREAGGAATDAGTSARLNALQAQREQLANLENMRLGAERYKTDTGTGLEFGLGQTRLATNQDIEGRRLQAAQNRAGLATGSELNLGGLRSDVETGIANRNLGTAQFNTQTGIGLEQGAESESARRSYERALNRQNTAAELRNERAQRGFGISDRTSGRTQTVADARRGDEQSYRDYLERQQGTAGNMYQTGANRAVQAQGVTGNQSQDAANALANYDIARRNSKSWFERNVSPVVDTFTPLVPSSKKK